MNHSKANILKKKNLENLTVEVEFKRDEQTFTPISEQ